MPTCAHFKLCPWSGFFGLFCFLLFISYGIHHIKLSLLIKRQLGNKILRRCRLKHKAPGWPSFFSLGKFNITPSPYPDNTLLGMNEVTQYWFNFVTSCLDLGQQSQRGVHLHDIESIHANYVNDLSDTFSFLWIIYQSMSYIIFLKYVLTIKRIRKQFTEKGMV